MSKIKIVATTWYKDSHSLYDYQSTKIVEKQYQFDLSTKGINAFRKKSTSEILAVDCNKTTSTELEDYEFIGHFQVEAIKNVGVRMSALSASTYRDKSKNISNEKQKTNESIDSINEREQEPYFIVGRGKNGQDSTLGYKLIPGMTIKLGRVEYYVSECFDGVSKTSKPLERTKYFFNQTIMKFTYDPSQKRDTCKICLDDHNNADNFLFNPCKCAGSCGSVHFECLIEWIRIKVKKQVIGGTIHYNFTKFECQVCKTEFPGYIQVQDTNALKFAFLEMIGVEKPKGCYLILQSISEKQKSIMVIQNTPEDGIKVGRGHECQIRITDISVSRKHAMIRNVGKDFQIYDNKSKFGTLVKEEGVSFQINKQQEKRSIQIGRSVLEFNLIK